MKSFRSGRPRIGVGLAGRSIPRPANPGRILAAALFCGAAAPAAAHPLNCVPRELAADRLDALGEARAAAGVTQNGNLAELWLDPETGTWTIFFSTPDGIACQVMSGAAWQEAPEPQQGDDT